ncbi:hypothetical protein BD779DRAFT_1469551 [Infundibulicybe gibba]|nr:hypothetical protein BD779DRAFT_1469551 [Infundibulicybe gibba]
MVVYATNVERNHFTAPWFTHTPGRQVAVPTLLWVTIVLFFKLESRQCLPSPETEVSYQSRLHYEICPDWAAPSRLPSTLCSVLPLSSGDQRWLLARSETQNDPTVFPNISGRDSGGHGDPRRHPLSGRHPGILLIMSALKTPPTQAHGRGRLSSNSGGRGPERHGLAGVRRRGMILDRFNLVFPLRGQVATDPQHLPTRKRSDIHWANPTSQRFAGQAPDSSKSRGPAMDKRDRSSQFHAPHQSI